MKKLFKKLYFLLPMFLALPVYAEEPPRIGGGGSPDNPSIASVVNRILEYLFPLAGLLAVIFIIQGGYMWIISAGDPSKVKQAQGTLTWAVIGLIVILVIFSVLQAILKFMS